MNGFSTAKRQLLKPLLALNQGNILSLCCSPSCTALRIQNPVLSVDSHTLSLLTYLLSGHSQRYSSERNGAAFRVLRCVQLPDPVCPGVAVQDHMDCAPELATVRRRGERSSVSDSCVNCDFLHFVQARHSEKGMPGVIPTSDCVLTL